MEELIKEISKKTIFPFQKIVERGTKNTKEFSINCAELEDFKVGIRLSEKYRELFSELEELRGPCLYYFEILSENLPSEIVAKIKEYKTGGKNPRSIPFIKKTILESKILYVGKVKRYFWGRLIQHLGYYKEKRTQGLQLYYWAKELNLRLKIVVYEFEPDMINLMEVLENDLAKHLKPLLGKHK